MGLEIREQLTKHLTDAHSIEEQSLQQMKTAPDITGEPGLEQAFREHRRETEGHERRIRTLLESRDASPSRVKDLVMRAGGSAFMFWGRIQPDTPGKLAAHALSYEALEWASYDLQLRRVAQRAGDHDTIRVAERIIAQERATAEALVAAFDEAVSAALAAQHE